MRSASGTSLLASALLFLSACARVAPQPAPAATFLADFEPLPERRCFAAEQPRHLPAAKTLLDSAGLRSTLREVSRIRQLSGGYAVLSLLFAPDGSVLRNEMIDSNLSPEEQSRIEEALRSHLHQQPHYSRGGERWGVQLRLLLAEEPGMQVGRQEICPAVRIGPAQRAGVIANVAAGRDSDQPYTDADRVRVRIRVDEQGATTARVVQGSRSGAFDAEAASIARAGRYLPMLVDRIPVATEFERSFP